MLQSILDDARVALRGLRHAPGFTALVVLTLAVAIGANTAIFSVVDAVLLRPLPYPGPDRIITINLDRPGVGVGEIALSDTSYPHFREKNRTLEELGVYRVFTEFALTGVGEPTQISVGVVSNSVYAVLGIAPIRGRLPRAEEDVPDGPLVALLSERLWSGRFGGDPGVIGTTIELDGRTREVIGVMAADFAFPSGDNEAWIPLQHNPASQNVGQLQYRAIARLRDRVTLEAATADVQGLVERLGEAGFEPRWFETIFAGTARLRTLKETVVGDSRRLLFIVLGAASFVLLIACANVANLFLVRADARARLTAVRAALGATRARLARQLLTEGVFLALVGGIGGLLLAAAGIQVLLRMAPASVPRLDGLGVNGTVFWYATGVSVLVGLLFAVIPALQAGSPRRVRAALSDGGRGSTVGHDRIRLRGLLVFVQVALAIVLMIGSGLMVRSFRELTSVDPGFDPRGVVTLGLRFPPNRYPTDASAQFLDQLLERVRRLPGVESAGAAGALPLLPGPGYTVAIEEFPTPADEFPPVFSHNWITPGYFETMRIPVREGRTVEPSDHQQRLGTVFISDSIKAEYWPSASALGERIQTFGRWGEVAGVVGNVRSYALNLPPPETIYLPVDWPRSPNFRDMSIVVRSSSNLADLIPMVRTEVAALDPDMPLSDIQMMEDVVLDSMSRTTFVSLLLGLAALVAAFLGCVGIYGVVSYVVGQRTSEIGLRVALGAKSSEILSLVMRRGLTPTAVGVAVGLAAAALLSRVLAEMLFEVGRFDPFTFVAGPVLFLGIGTAACLLPARRATTIDPATALRRE